VRACVREKDNEREQLNYTLRCLTLQQEIRSNDICAGLGYPQLN